MPQTRSSRTVKFTGGKQNFKWSGCGRQFGQNPQNQVISQEIKELRDKLLLEKLPDSAIARVTGVSEPWLQKYVNNLYQTLPSDHLSRTN